MGAEVKIVSLTEQSLELAADSLSRAFDADPLQCYAFPDADERRNRPPAHFRPFLDYGIHFGEVLTTAGNAIGRQIDSLQFLTTLSNFIKMMSPSRIGTRW